MKFIALYTKSLIVFTKTTIKMQTSSAKHITTSTNDKALKFIIKHSIVLKKLYVKYLITFKYETFISFKSTFDKIQILLFISVSKIVCFIC